ncbi:MAG: carboxylating nicotinate-nucleotide diphosphorylase [Planctomycetaceae bacterium]|jgi:nicotinate-nucleotide pyrophosphorylase (carboxylating)|nr:carboxylating nicotinate-nucleotide diphosphorylase [Planctomycetaceae bacterium]MBT4723626.1 carboxylating nicotinate-nucleotide diphosphorylase [Planctomycetaceae bacterium]MBT4846447.1 carboxylating nicotinate-nucleotide diphosphorylase [Planctomycetaceae bacterium]MBT5598919.1 carboxylating nicotinate-nucleotide diphosphorylase [Planctomycetaceae bacterium]MBT5884483.1 carboxylating nicotinate-nucleotide diphosphorylase [Planctomycetaceae bacterium]
MGSLFTQQEWSAELIDDLRQLVRLSVREDIADQYDWTSVATVPLDKQGAANVVIRQSGIVAGVQIAEVVFDEMSINGEVRNFVADGDVAEAGMTAVSISASAIDLLTAERIILNFMGRLCGIATQTSEYVKLLAGTGVAVYDTRKTTPGWRRLEKYATRCGGAVNHRNGLHDAILIKDNHLAACAATLSGDDGSDVIGEAIEKSRELIQDVVAAGNPIDAAMPIEIEVDTLEQLQIALSHHPDIVLLDNMSNDQLRNAVALRSDVAPEVQLEASGGVTHETIRAIAETGVDRISVGALTHSAKSLDVALDWTSLGSP